VLWYTLHGHHPADAADRREAAPRYTTKTEPSLSGMLAKLRRVIIAARFLPTSPGRGCRVIAECGYPSEIWIHRLFLDASRLYEGFSQVDLGKCVPSSVF
jgi:hypothetical protein